MYVPSARERVFLAGRSGAYLVLSVDQESQRADLLPLVDGAYVEEDVPFSVIRPWREEAPLEIN